MFIKKYFEEIKMKNENKNSSEILKMCNDLYNDNEAFCEDKNKLQEKSELLINKYNIDITEYKQKYNFPKKPEAPFFRFLKDFKAAFNNE